MTRDKNLELTFSARIVWVLGQEFPFDQHQTIEILLSGNILQYYGVILLKRQERNSSGNQLFFQTKFQRTANISPMSTL